MDVSASLVSNPQVLAYFAALGWAVRGCYARLGRAQPSGAATDGGKNLRGVFLALAASVVAVTWFLILRWTVEYKRGGGDNLFDAAYIDVLKAPHFGLSSQLLTWVVVAAVWAHGAHPCA